VTASVAYSAVLPVRLGTVVFVSRLLMGERRRRGTRAGTRKLGCFTLWGSKTSSQRLACNDLVPSQIVGHHLDLWRCGCCTSCSAVSSGG
jgi:hypothetical protein